MQSEEITDTTSFEIDAADRQLLINQFNASGKIWEILPKRLNCDQTANNCLTCNDGQSSLMFCASSDLVIVSSESGKQKEFTPFEVLDKVLGTDPISWLIKEEWMTTTSIDGRQFTHHIGKVSYFSGPIQNTKPAKEMTIQEVYEFIRGETLKDVTIELRKIKKLDEKRYKAEKEKRLPYVTFGGTFNRRADNQLKEKSEHMCFDIDHLDDIEITKKTLLEDTNLGIVMLLTSPGGDGVKMVIRSPDGDNYKEVYERIMKYLKIKHNITVDSTQEISRACFLCHDPDAYYNGNAPLTRIPETTQPTLSRPLSKHEPNNGASNRIRGAIPDIEKVETYISALEDKSLDITENYHDWVKVGFSIASLGEEGRPLFHRLSEIHPKYVYDDADKKFTNLLHTSRGHVSLATFYHYCHQMGVRPSQDMSLNYITPPSSTKQVATQSNKKRHVAEIENADDKRQRGDHAPSDIDWDEVLRKHEIKPTDDIPIPPIAWKNGQATCGTLGNFSLIIGKAKSRKSFFVSLVISGVLKPDNPRNPFSGALPKQKNKVIYFDTEQSKYHVQCALKRICTMVGDEGSAPLMVFALRPMSPQERMAAIDHAITTTDGLGIVIIDGIADLQTDINDPEQAVMVATALLKWTEFYNIHIITVLHENKGDRNARGHLGTELVNKSETTLSVTKDSVNEEISIVEPEYCRNKEPAAFAFEIDENGLPVENRSYCQRTGKTVKAEKLADEAIKEIFNKVFAKNDKISYTSLWRGVKLAFYDLYFGHMSDNEAKNTVEIAKLNDRICQDKPRGPYSLCVEQAKV